MKLKLSCTTLVKSDYHLALQSTVSSEKVSQVYIVCLGTICQQSFWLTEELKKPTDVTKLVSKNGLWRRDWRDYFYLIKTEWRRGTQAFRIQRAVAKKGGKCHLYPLLSGWEEIGCKFIKKAGCWKSSPQVRAVMCSRQLPVNLWSFYHQSS